MVSLRETRDLILLSHCESLIDDEEMLLLYDLNKSKNPDIPFWLYSPFVLEELSDDECKTDFRFFKDDIYRLSRVLRVPEFIICQNGVKVTGIEALCVYLKRFAYPCRYSDLIPRFARDIPQICLISNAMMNHIYNEHHNLLENMDQSWLSREHLQLYANAIHSKGAYLSNCWGFVDGTVRPVSRPRKNQRAVYNGHKRVHSLKFQSVVTPNGMIANLYGPLEGKRHDCAMLAFSGILPKLEEISFAPNGDPLCIFGDAAYPLRVHMQRPFKGVGLTPNEKEFNKSMSRVRVSVEWLFGEIINYYKFLDFKKNLKIGLSAVGKMYLTCALLQNAHTCLYGNNTSKYFGIPPPSLEDYFNLR